MDMLYETFELYHKKAKDCYEKGELLSAKRYFMLASEQMLKLAKQSKGELQKARYQRAKSLLSFAESIKENHNSLHMAVSTDESSNTPAVEKLTLEEALERLYQLEGLQTVKNEVRDWIDQVKVFKMRREMGMSIPDMSYHMVFMGNPGTGKTTVARMISQIYCALGILSKGHLVEVDRSMLVAGYVGQTAIKTQEVIAKAVGGVLFIDEAYSLTGGGNSDFGQEAIETVLKAMEDHRSDLVVIVAGYDDLMENFINSNPGLRSRFKKYIHFTDYTGFELYRIFSRMCHQNQYYPNEQAQIVLKNYFNDLYNNRNQNFGNARDVRNLFETVITRQSKRIASAPSPTAVDMSEIIADDIPVEPSFVQSNSTPDCTKTISTPPSTSTNSETRKKITEETSPPSTLPEDKLLENILDTGNGEFKFDWDSLPIISFDDVAGLDAVKETVNVKVLLPLKNPEAFDGYVKKNGGGLLLYGPPGTGKTMIAAAIANEIGAKFCSVKPSDLLHQGAGQSEKAVRALFAQARQFPCSVIYFDEMDSISPKSTRSQYAKQMRSELLAQLQGIDSYKKDKGNILFLIAATNKPWDIDSAFLRPGRFGTRVYVGLPDTPARRYMFDNRLKKISQKGVVAICEDIDIEKIVSNTEGFNGSDISNLMDRIEEISILRGIATGEKYINSEDFECAMSEIGSSVQKEDIEKLMAWKSENA